jgi:RNA polymerase sigma factor (sigma-70 family)
MANAQLGTVLRQLRRMVQPRAYEDTSDRELLERFLAQREEAAFVILMKRHGPMVLNVCRRVQGNEHDAEDVFQATFLLLACKADTIRKQDSLASWLHGVAHRLALEARGQGARRQARERRAADMRRTSGVSDKAWQELQATLDEALCQVPEKYRVPLLLCYLEGKTQEEAASQLGCPLGTVRSRLARGRNYLKEVLQRRGIRLSAAALAAALAGSTASATLPSGLLQTTARAAVGYAAGTAPGALVSARAAALLEGGLKAMATVKLQIAFAVAFVIGALSLAAGVLAPRVLAGSSQASAEAEPAVALAGPSAEPESRGKDKEPGAASKGPAAEGKRQEGIVHGRVLDREGKPLEGAKLLLLGKGEKPENLGTSAANGHFTVAVPKDPTDHYLIARTDGAGIDFISLGQLKPAEPVELRLVKDRVIRGRIVDTQGKPAVGARVAVKSLGVYAGNSLDPFLAEWKKRHFMSGIPGGVKHLWRDEGCLLPAVTDAEGRFTIAGAGAERLVTLRVSGPGIADAELWVVNRDGFDPRPYNEATRNNIPNGFDTFGLRWLLYGPDLSIVAEAEKLIRGVLTEADTGQPRAGVQVSLTRNGKNLVPLILRAKTDAAGRYEIHGARKAKAYMVEVLSDPAAGYMACQVQAADTAGYQPVTADIRVAKGVIVTGKVIDKTTGQVVPGFAMAAVLNDNPFVKDYPEFGSSAWIRTRETDAEDGTFRVVTIPGPVLLMGGPNYKRLPGGPTESMKYKPPVPDPKYPQYFAKFPDSANYYGPGGGMSPVQGNFCKVLVIKPGTAIVNEDVILEQARAVSVKIQDAEGRPVTGARVTGISPRNWERPIQIDKDACSAYLLETDKPRLMVFYEPGRKLMGTLTLKGDEKGPVVAKLGPSGGVRGRLVTEDGKPLAKVVVEPHYAVREAEEVHEFVHRAKQVVTDANGAFQIDELIPGVGFTLYHHRAKQASLRSQKIDKTFKVQPGESLNLGDLPTKPAPEGNEE